MPHPRRSLTDSTCQRGQRAHRPRHTITTGGFCQGVNDEIKNALLKRATGYEVEEKEIILDKTGREVKRIKVTKKHIPPDLNAAKYIQEMRRTGEW